MVISFKHGMVIAFPKMGMAWMHPFFGFDDYNPLINLAQVEKVELILNFNDNNMYEKWAN